MEEEQSLWLQIMLCLAADRPAPLMGQTASIGSQIQQGTGACVLPEILLPALQQCAVHPSR